MDVYGQQTTGTTPAGTRYYVYRPPSYTPGTPAPLLVSLHGGAGIDYSLNKLLINSAAKIPVWLIDRGLWDTSRPFIVVTPQLTRDPAFPNFNDQEWPVAKIDSVIEHIKGLYTVDTDRIYLQGISLGGAACWKYAAAFPNKVAAVLTQSGKTETTEACLVKNIPTWVLHGATDGLVVPNWSISMVNAINSCSPAGGYKPRLTMLDVKAHEGWDELFDLSSGYRVYEWLLRFSKSDLTNKPPYVSAGADFKILQGTASITLTGDYFDVDGSVSNVVWSQESGPNTLTLNGVNAQRLSVSNMIPGTYVIKLTATDNSGAQLSDTMTLQIVSNSGPIVTNLYLTDGAGTTDIMPLSDGLVINKKDYPPNTQFNIRAVTAGNARSVRFGLNTDQNVRSPTNLNTPPPITIRRGAWTVPVGEHTVYVTPYSATIQGGTVGISLCFKITVIDEVLTTKNFYSKPNSNIGQLSSWGLNTDGSGTAPTSFTANNQIFNVSNNVNVGTALTISGTSSVLWVRNGGSLIINQALTAPVHTQGNASIEINTSQPVNLATISSTSTISFAAAATAIPAGTYANIAVKGNGTTKTLAANTTTITGNCTIENNVMVQGAAANNSVLSIGGNLNIQEDGPFVPTTKFSVQLTSGAAQALNIQSTQVAFNQLTLNANTVATFNGPATSSTLQLGAATAGGLVINNGARLVLGKHNLSIVDKGTINSTNQTGQLSFKKSSLQINTTATEDSHLYLLQNADSLRAITLSTPASRKLILHSKTFITDSVKCINGTLQSDGQLTLVSTELSTARIAAREGTGAITGEIEYQRYIESGRMWKYFGFPVKTLTVAEVQPYITITGAFTGASTGSGLGSNPSLYYYNEAAAEQWVAYPVTTNTEGLNVGTGYSIFTRKASSDTKLIAKGEIQNGDFPFTLSPNPTPTQNNGWNLLGNPYASPIQWNATEWTRSGINASVYIRDNSVPEGRFLVWNGTTGDAEFGGKIAQGQAFWVRTTSATRSLVIHESAKINQNAVLFREKSDDTPSTLIVEMQKGTLLDRTYLAFNPEGREEFSNETDAVKQKNGYFNISTLSTDNIQLAIDNLPASFCDKEVSLSVDSTTAGTYSLTFTGSYFSTAESELYLYDQYLDSTVQLSRNKLYNFNISTNKETFGNERFRLRFQSGLSPVSITQQDNTLLSSADTGNQWLLNGTEIEGATDGLYEPSATGSYQVKVTKGSCSTVSDPIVFTITGTDPSRETFIRIYPNPASSYLHIVGTSKNSSEVHYEIINTLGASSVKGQLTVSELQQGTDIPLSIRPGVYILKTNNGKESQRIRFVVE